jgi:co-chaperonin GroES (HSP10)
VDLAATQRVREEEKTKGGIIIPDTAKEKPQEGEVIAVGPGRQDDGKVIALDVKAGDRIFFGNNVAALGTQRHRHGICEQVDAIENAVARLFSELDDFRRHDLFSS